MSKEAYNPKTGEINLSKPYNKIHNPVVHRYEVWKQDKFSILKAAQNERQRLMQEVADRQKIIKQLTEIMEQHQKPVEGDYPPEMQYE